MYNYLMSQADKKDEGPKENRAPLIARDAYDHFKTLQAMGLLKPDDETRVKQYEEAERLKREEEERKRTEAQRRRETEMASAAKGGLVASAGARLNRVEQGPGRVFENNAAEPAGESEEVVDTEATRKSFEQQIAGQVRSLREAGEKWNDIVATLAENFGLSEKEIRRTVKKKNQTRKSASALQRKLSDRQKFLVMLQRIEKTVTFIILLEKIHVLVI